MHGTRGWTFVIMFSPGLSVLVFRVALLSYSQIVCPTKINGFTSWQDIDMSNFFEILTHQHDNKMYFYNSFQQQEGQLPNSKCRSKALPNSNAFGMWKLFAYSWVTPHPSNLWCFISDHKSLVIPQLAAVFHCLCIALENSVSGRLNSQSAWPRLIGVCAQLGPLASHISVVRGAPVNCILIGLSASYSTCRPM